MKKNLPLFLCILCFLYALLRFPAPLLLAGANSVSLFLTKVFPSLFPFMIACGLLLKMGVAEEMGYYLSPLMSPLFRLPGIAAFPFFLGIFAGYPLGAKMTATLYQEGKLSLAEAEHILTFSNNPGPLFLVGTVATGFFSMAFWGYAMLFCCFLGAVTTGVFVGFSKAKNKRKPMRTTPPKQHAFSLVEAFPPIMADSLETVLQIGGYLLLFGVLTEALSQLGIFSFLCALLSFLPLSPAFFQGLGSGFLEMTNGAYLLSLAPDALSLRLSGTCFLVAFGGLSILGQTYGILKTVPIEKSRYFQGKLLNGLFSCLYFSALFPFLERNAQKAVPVFSYFTETAIFSHASIWFPLLFLLATCCFCLCRK